MARKMITLEHEILLAEWQGSEKPYNITRYGLKSMEINALEHKILLHWWEGDKNRYNMKC